MSASGVSALFADAYENAMASKSSFTLEFLEGRVQGADDTVTHEVVGDSKVHASGFKRRDFDEYRLDNLVVSRATHRGSNLFGAFRRDHFPFNWLIQSDLVHGIVDGGDFSEPTETEVDGDTVFKLTSQGVKSENSSLHDFYDADRIPEFEATLLVRPDATIKDLDSRTTVIQGSDLTEFTFGVKTRAFGETTVSAPDWKSQAQSKAPDISPRIQDNHIVLSHTGGQTLPRQTRIRMFTSGEYGGSVEFKSSVTEGDNLWVWHEGSELKLSHEEPTTSNPGELNPADRIGVELSPISVLTIEVKNF